MPANLSNNVEFNDLLVLIPGIGGSTLTKNGTTVWSPQPGAALRAVLSRGNSIRDLQITKQDDPNLDDLGDGVVATRLVPDLHVVPGLGWKIDGYDYIRDQLTTRLSLKPGKNYFELPYDWRRDNRVAARRLKRNTDGWLKAWRAAGHPDAKLVLVCHSMGGIVSRWFLEQLDGWRDTRTLVTFGTPYSGSVNALDFLSNGFHKSWGPFTLDLSDTLRSFTSVYQLLPSYRCLRMIDGSYENIDGSIEVPNLYPTEKVKVKSALTLHRTLRQTVDTHIANQYNGQGGYDIRPVIGDFQATGYSGTVHDSGVIVAYQRTAQEQGGDGTVPKISAIPHELLKDMKNAIFVNEKHGSLQNNNVVIDHLVGVLLSRTQSDVPLFPAGNVNVAVEVNDAFTTETVVVRAKAQTPGFTVTAVATPIGGGDPREVELEPDPKRTGGVRAELRGWPAGDYRLRVEGVGVNSVNDIFSIVDPAEIGA